MILKNKRVLFLYDYSKKIGNGHLQRCKYFSKIFPKNFKLNFVKTKSKGLLSSRKKIYEYGIIDSYLIKIKDEKILKKICQKLIMIDDFKRKSSLSNIVINYSPLANKNFYKDNGNKFLLGSKFNFINLNEKIEKFSPKKKFNILIYFGLRNRQSLIQNIIAKIKNKSKFDKISIFGGKKKKSHKEFLYKMKKSDIIICSSGVTLQEAILRKKIIFSKYLSENQKSFFKFYKKKRIIEDLKSFSKFINLPLNEMNRSIKYKQDLISKFMEKRKKKSEYWNDIKNV